MAFPASFDESNLVLMADSVGDDGASVDSCWSDGADCLSVLKAVLDEQPCLISCWKLTADELQEIIRTGRVWIAVV